MAELLFELGVEELPAGFLAKAIIDLEALATERLATLRLEHEGVRVLGAPRRLTLSVVGLARSQRDLSEQVLGPAAKVAFDAEGRPTRAAEGFAQKNGVPASALRVVEVPGKGPYVAADRQEQGQGTSAILPRLLAELVRAIPWKKSMRWGSLDESFARPVHWLVALYAGEVVPLTLFGITSGRTTFGHRFLAPGAIELGGSIADYVARLRGARVLVDPAERRAAAAAELARIEVERGLRVRRDDTLLDEVANLVEWPRAVTGAFDEALLALPEDVIVSSMRGHQRYFATERVGGLDNRFVTIAGTVVADEALVASGNERVLRARLADAEFFFAEDRKTGLDAMADRLGGVVFQTKLGTVAEKAARLAGAGGARALSGATPECWARAARLAKADLVSKMVGEFPDLQGGMGRRYAELANEPPEVALAIFEHYLPRGGFESVPTAALGAALGLADRVDTLVGCFAVGLAPTGSGDLFGLRRAALATLHLLLERGWHTPLGTLVDEAATLLAGKITWTPALREKLLEFVRTRFEGLLVEPRRRDDQREPAVGLAADCVAAALAAGFEDVPDAAARATAVARLRDRADFEPLGVAFRRVANILDGQDASGVPDSAQFVHESEGALYAAFTAVRERVGAATERARTASATAASAAADYGVALAELATLEPHVARFFDGVMVLDPEPTVRRNRLALLGMVNAAFLRIADFRKLAVGQGPK
ncbi:MAG: glycine--tRNA ligase subunit beta [Myxococcales bacterium]|nr:glycine--tRNA ligase subunit beta [Myxococcales bacterium]